MASKLVRSRRRRHTSHVRSAPATEDEMIVGQLKSNAIFATTHWTMVLAAAQASPSLPGPAWEYLARTYWYPVYAYIRHRGNTREDAADLTQSFFARLIEKRTLEGLEREGGRFRSFLLVCLNRFLTQEWRRGQAGNRRPVQGWVPFDAQAAEQRDALAGATSRTPEEVFERRWAEALVDRTLVRLEADYAAGGKAGLCAHLVAYLNDDPDALPHADVAARTGLSPSSVRVELVRLRQRFRQLFRAEIAATVSQTEVEDELHHLFRVLSK